MKNNVKKRFLVFLISISLISMNFLGFNIKAYAITNTGKSFDTAIPVSFGTNYIKKWAVNEASDGCYNTFTTSENGCITFRFTKPTSSNGNYLGFYFELYNSSGGLVWSGDTEYTNKVLPYYEFSVGLNAGKYYLNVINQNTYISEEINTSYKVNFVPGNNYEVEPNNGLTNASPVTLGQTIKGFVGNGNYRTTYDYFKLNLSKDTNVKVSIDTFEELDSNYGDFGFINSKNIKDILLSSDWRVDSDGSYYTLLNFTKGDNYFYIEKSYHQKQYSITFTEVKIDKPVLLGIDRKKHVTEIKWQPINDVDGYIVYRSDTADGVYTNLTNINDASITSFRENYPIQDYYYKIRAYKTSGYKTIYSEFSNEIKYTNKKPVINASDITIIQGMDFNRLKGVSALDYEDGDLSSEIYVSGEVNATKAGEYNLTYTVTDSHNEQEVKSIKVTVLKSDWANHWGTSYIKNAMSVGMVDASAAFRPEDPINRAEFIKIVNRAFGFTEKGNISYSDVKTGYWYYDEVRIAAKAGYISLANKTFRPNDPITREEVAVIITNLKKNKDSNTDKLNSYKDNKNVSSWARPSVEGAIEAGYMGKGSLEFRPQDKMVRAEAVTALSRIK